MHCNDLLLKNLMILSRIEANKLWFTRCCLSSLVITVNKTDDLFAKLIVKIANHYQTAQLTAEPEIIDRTMETSEHFNQVHHHKVGTAGVIKLIILTVIICMVAYYFGL